MSLELPFHDKNIALFSVGQVATMLNIQPAFLRRLDNEEVIQPARSDGGQRRYSQNQIHAVQRIIGLTTEGLTLAGIKKILILEAEVESLKKELAKYRNNDSPPPKVTG